MYTAVARLLCRFCGGHYVSAWRLIFSCIHTDAVVSACGPTCHCSEHQPVLNDFYMQKFYISAISITLFAMLYGCSDDASMARTSDQKNAGSAKINLSNVEKPIALKELFIGMNIKKVKGAKKLSNQAYMFDFDYFGSKRTFLASTNENGDIYEYKAVMDGSFDLLKIALEEKLTTDNSKSVIFDCKTSILKPDSSAEITTQSCKVSGKLEILTIEEMKVQPTEKYAGRSQLPTVVFSIKLEGTVLAAEVRSAEENARAKSKRADDTLRKKDI